MAQTENGFYYPDDYTKVADVPGDLKKLAESIDVEVGNIKSNQSTNSKDIEQLKKTEETQNKNIEQISDNILDISKEQQTQSKSIEELQKNQENLQTEVQELNEDIKANAIIEETEKSKSLYIDDANASRGKVNVFGNMEQETRKGYNLLDISEINSTWTQWKTENFKYKKYQLKPNTSYTVSQLKNRPTTGTVSETSYLYITSGEEVAETLSYSINGALVGAPRTVTSDSNGYIIVYAAVNDVTFTNDLGLMLVEGTEEKEYEAYGASPSFNYRSEIKCLQENVEIKHINKNLVDLISTTLKVSGWNMSESYNEGDEKILKVPYNKNSVWDAFFFYLDERYVGKNVSFSFDIKVKNLKYLGSDRFVLENTAQYAQSVIKNLYSSSLKEDTYVHIEAENYKLKNKTIGIMAGVNYKSEEPDNGYMYVYIKNFQIELGEQATEFKENQEESYSLDIQQDMVSPEDDYFDLERKKEVHGWEKIIFDGTENITKVLDNIYNYTLIKKAKAILNNNTSHKSNKYKSVICTGNNDAFVIAATSDYAINLNSGDGMILRIKDIRNLNINDFKASLVQQHESGEPTIVYYKLETPIELDLTDTQIEQLEKLNKLRFYEGVNNIMTLEDIALIQAEYSVNLKDVNNKMRQEIDEIKELLSTTQTSAMLLDNLEEDLIEEVK